MSPHPCCGGKLHSFSDCFVDDLKAQDSKYLDKSWCSAFHSSIAYTDERFIVLRVCKPTAKNPFAEQMLLKPAAMQ